MPLSPARLKSNHKYDAKAYYKIGVRFKRSDYDSIKEAISASGESFNSFVVGAVMDKLKRLQNAPESTQSEEQ